MLELNALIPLSFLIFLIGGIVSDSNNENCNKI